jgi:hypothetical protein
LVVPNLTYLAKTSWKRVGKGYDRVTVGYLKSKMLGCFTTMKMNKICNLMEHRLTQSSPQCSGNEASVEAATAQGRT